MRRSVRCADQVAPAQLLPVLQLIVPSGYDPTVMGPLYMDFESSQYEPTCGTPLVPGSLVVPLTLTDEQEAAAAAASSATDAEDPPVSVLLPSRKHSLSHFVERKRQERDDFPLTRLVFRIHTSYTLTKLVESMDIS